MTDCVFCKIVAGEISCTKIYEDSNYFAFLDLSQFVPGHTLVIPKLHARFVWDSPDIGNYLKVVQKIANHYRDLGYKYVDSLSFGRGVPHAHVHLLPHNNDLPDYIEVLEKMEDLSRKHPPLTPENWTDLMAKFQLSE